jgi:hypothetical protein
MDSQLQTKHSNPLDYLISFAETNGVDTFVINNAKDELHRLRNQYSVVAWGKVNSQGDLYDLRTQENPFTPKEISVPLYSDIVKYKDFYAKHSK